MRLQDQISRFTCVGLGQIAEQIDMIIFAALLLTRLGRLGYRFLKVLVTLYETGNSKDACRVFSEDRARR